MHDDRQQEERERKKRKKEGRLAWRVRTCLTAKWNKQKGKEKTHMERKNTYVRKELPMFFTTCYECLLLALLALKSVGSSASPPPQFF